MLASPHPRWVADAACRDHPEVNFFPARGESIESALAVCAGCLVRVECLDYSLALGCHLPGVWGGLSENQRRRSRRTRHAEVYPSSQLVGAVTQ